MNSIEPNGETNQTPKNVNKVLKEVINAGSDPILLIDFDLNVIMANRQYYSYFKIDSPIEGQHVNKVKNNFWYRPKVEKLFTKLAKGEEKTAHVEQEVQIPDFGTSILKISARVIPKNKHSRQNVILIHFNDLTNLETLIATSEAKFRRLYETAQDGIILMDPKTNKITDANPYFLNIIGYEKNEIVGKKLWEIGFIIDKEKSVNAVQELNQRGYVRYEHLPLKSKKGDIIEVEFICNTYDVTGKEVVQCNIRDISDRVKAERLQEEKTEELARFYKLFVGRELKMKELKKEVEDLKRKLAKKVEKE